MVAVVEDTDNEYVWFRLLEWQKDTTVPVHNWKLKWKIVEMGYWRPVAAVSTRNRLQTPRKKLSWSESMRVIPVCSEYEATQIKKGAVFPGKIQPFDPDIKFIGSERSDLDIEDVIGMLFVEEVVFFVRDGDWHVVSSMGDEFIVQKHMFEERFTPVDSSGRDTEFGRSFRLVMTSAHLNSVKHGFWDKQCNDAEKLALMHSELSEALEAIRHDNPKSEHIPEFSGVEEELADVIIRIMDYAGGKGYTHLPEAILAKMKFNVSRDKMHGKKC